jgi:hypothetical protein
MHNYTHHIAGRWRTRYPQIKNQPGRARAVEAALRRIKGVTLVEASPLTGSLLICYDAHGADRVALMEALHAAKRELGLAAAPSRVEPMANASMTSNALGDKLLGMLVEKCVERSALALIAALI